MSDITLSDCLYLVVFSHSLVSSKDYNHDLALFASNLRSGIQIICPAQIWYYAQDYSCSDFCIPILSRDCTLVETSVTEIIEEVVKICGSQGGYKIGVIAHLNDQQNCVDILIQNGFKPILIEFESLINQDL
jgi:hypothetical protein